MRLFSAFATVVSLTQASDSYASRVALLEQRITAATERVVQLLERRNRSKFGDFYPTLDSCTGIPGDTPPLDQLWRDACRLSDSYGTVNDGLIQFSEAANNQMQQNENDLNVAPIFLRQLKQNYGTLNVNVQTVMSKTTCGSGENAPSCQCHSQVCSFPSLLLSPTVDQQDAVRTIDTRNLETLSGSGSVPAGAGNCLVETSLGIVSLGGSADSASIKTYNTTTNKFEQSFARLPDAGRSHFACTVESGKVWICGGIRTVGTSFDYLDSCYSANENDLNSWTNEPSLAQARGFISRSMRGHTGLMISGGSFNGKRLASVETLGEQGWEITGQLPVATDNHVQVATSDATYVFGGSEDKKMVVKSSGASGFEIIGELESMRVGATGHVINKDIYIVDGNPLTEELTIELWHHEGKFFYRQKKVHY